MAKKIAVSAWGECLVERSVRDPWPLLEYLEDRGLKIVPLKSNDYRHYVALDHNAKHFRRVKKVDGLRTKTLVIFEPRAVHPLQHRLAVSRQYDRVLLQSEKQRMSPGNRVLQWGNLPESISLNFQNSSLKSSDGRSIAFLNENKFSFVTGNYYKLRQQALEGLAAAGFQIRVGGRNWNRGFLWRSKAQIGVLLRQSRAISDLSLSNWRFRGLGEHKNLVISGAVPNGQSFLGLSRLALIIENDPHYVSEKLINALVAGTVPVYVGPELGGTNIPENLIFRAFPNSESIVDAVRSLTDEEITKRAVEIAKWTSDTKNLEPWSQNFCLEALAREIWDFVSEEQSV